MVLFPRGMAEMCIRDSRYATGYLGDIGVPKDPAPMDFAGWFEAYLGSTWYRCV